MSNQRVQNIFDSVLSEFKLLHGKKEVSLLRATLKNATMNARPIISFRGFILGDHSYQVITGKYVKDSTDMPVNSLPEEVLRGWFAHELGHIMDYRNRSSLGLIWFGIRYLSSSTYRRRSEYIADQYAIRHGFHEEIITAKRFILENDLLTPEYKAIIDKYYMPIHEVQWHTDNPHSLENLFIG